MAQQRGLGKGFGSLIPDEVSQDVRGFIDETDRVQNVLISDIKPNPKQPRRDFAEAELLELAESIKTHGILQPVVVTANESGGYLLIAGERRWRAAQHAGIDTIPALIRSLDEQTQMEVALIENVQRQDLTPLEFALAIDQLHQQFNLTYIDLAKRLGKAQSTIKNVRRLLTLPDPAKRALAKRHITEGHARAILALKDDERKQQELLDLILRHNWSVQKAEQFVVAYKSGATDKLVAKARTDSSTAETKAISARLKAPVAIRRMARGGRLIISYKDDKDLNRITKQLSQD